MSKVIFKSLNKKLLSQFPNKFFIETGTQQGHGLEVAVDCEFEKIYSVDIDSQCHGHCTQKFKDVIATGRMELFIGDSAVVLAKILEQIDAPATFWLDAHAGAGLIGKAPCPVIYELQQIASHHIKTHTILIDDRRMFGHYWGKGINENDVIDTVKLINPDYTISYADGCEPRDIIVAHV
jgi:hypothetical protein